MSVTVDSLEIQIQSDSTSAVSGIDALSASLSKLKTAVSGGLGLSTIANQINKLNAATAGAGQTAVNLDKLATSLQKLSTVGQVKISSSIANQITKIGAAVNTIGQDTITKITSLGTALGTIPKVSFGSFNAKNLQNLASTLKGLDTSSIAQKFKELNTAVSPLASNLSTTASAFKQLSPVLQKAAANTDSVTSANGRAGNSYINLYAKIRLAIGAFRRIGNAVAGWISKSNKYIEDVNLFTASMGKYAQEAQKYAEQVGELMGIDPGDFMRNEGVFNTIIKGFGVVEDKAYTMSKNLTQLGYDISSFYNISVEDAMTKLTSGISGELEPLRRLGYDLSVARLQQDAYALGIKKTVSSMTQAEKSQLRYYEIMTQVTTAQGDMARTLESPANQLRIFEAQVNQAARALGNVFIPMLNAVLPYAIAVAKAIRLIAEEIARLFHFKLPKVDYSGLQASSTALKGVGSNAGEAGKNLGKATKQAKKLKNNLLGIDELNIISPENQTANDAGKSSGAGAGGSDLGIDLPTYDFLDGLVNSKVNDILEQIKKHLKDILEYALAIAAALAAWKIAKGIMNFIRDLQSFKGFTGLGGLAGLLGFLGDIVKMKRYIDDIVKNGPNFYNCAGIISTFAGMLGDAFIMLGQLKIGGVLKIVQGVGEIIAAIADWKINGFSSNTVLTALEGVADIITGIGLINRKWILVGSGLALTGLLGIIRQLDEIMKAIKTGNWDGVDKVALVLNSIEMLGGIGIALKGLSKSAVGAGLAQSISTALQDVLLNAAINLGVDSTAFAGAILSGAVAAIVAGVPMYIGGVVDALKNGLSLIDGIIVPIGSTLAGTGVATILAAAGTAVAPGIGTIIGLAVGLVTDGVILIVQNWDKLPGFFADVWNGMISFFAGIPGKIQAIITAIVKWFEALPGKIGYALGFAIGVIVKWTINIAKTVKEKIPVIIENVRKWFAELPGKIWNAITGAVAKLAKWASDMIAKVKEVVPKIIAAIVDFFKELPKKLYDLGKDIINGLLDGIKNAWESLKGGVKDFCGGFVQGFKDALGIHSPSTEFKAIGGYSADGLVEGVENKFNDVQNTFTDLASNVKSWFLGSGSENLVTKFTQFGTDTINGFKDKIGSSYTSTKSNVVTWANSVKSWFTSFGYGGINAASFSTFANNTIEGFRTQIGNAYINTRSIMQTWANSVKSWFSDIASNSAFGAFATNVINGFKDRIANSYTNARSAMTTFANGVKSWFENPDGSLVDKFKDIGKNVIQGFIDGVNSLWDKAMRKIKDFGKSIIAKGKEGTDEHSPSKAFREIGAFLIEGFNLGLDDVIPQSYKAMDTWLKRINSYHPTIGADFTVDTSSVKFADSTSFMGVATSSVDHQTEVMVDGYKGGMVEFYDQYMEPMMRQMADDIRRQADKKEQTIVQVGNRTISDAVVTQRNANGYRFVTEG